MLVLIELFLDIPDRLVEKLALLCFSTDAIRVTRMRFTTTRCTSGKLKASLRYTMHSLVRPTNPLGANTFSKSTREERETRAHLASMT